MSAVRNTKGRIVAFRQRTRLPGRVVVGRVIIMGILAAMTLRGLAATLLDAAEGVRYGAAIIAGCK